MRPRGSVPSAIAGVAMLVLLAGCSSRTDGEDLPTRPPATAAVASDVTSGPADQVLPVATPITDLLVVTGTGLLAALDGSATTLSIIDPATNPPAVRTIALPARAAAIAPGRTGEVLAALPNRVLRIDAASGTTTEVAVAGDVHAVQVRGDGSLVVGTADGKVRILSPAGEVLDTVSGLASADALALTGDRVSVLDRRQTSLTELDLRKDQLGLALRAGDGATNLITDHFGRIIVTDTAGDELLVYTAGPLVLRQRFPVRSSPYALAYDQRSDTVWVTCTQTNEVVGFDLSTGIPKEVGRFPTVRQPNSVAIDERTGDLFVGSATGDGLQRIRADQRKGGQ
ncbi:YncE family protein [Nocardia sp. GCM10030253]|uniref:YncE family protein n=1 Tax=Nocardia sp. GCM10030253 TaxID=3273404 RepID=UPI0036381B99